MEYSVIDNFLEQDKFESLQKLIVYNSNFPFFISSHVAVKQSDDVQYNESHEEHLWNWYASHLVYQHVPFSNHYEMISDLFFKKFNDLFGMTTPIRIKINFFPHTEVMREHSPHTDYDESHKAAVFSLNTCDGFTKLTDGTKIESISNRLVVFDGSKFHNSSTTTNQKGRYNINFNWF